MKSLLNRSFAISRDERDGTSIESHEQVGRFIGIHDIFIVDLLLFLIAVELGDFREIRFEIGIGFDPERLKSDVINGRRKIFTLNMP